MAFVGAARHAAGTRAHWAVREDLEDSALGTREGFEKQIR